MKSITRLTITLFVLITVLAFALSFTALQVTATNNGKPGMLSYAWPFLIDGGLVIFSLAVVYKSLRGEGAWWQWAMVGLFTVATVGFNVFQDANTVVKVLVAASAPIVLFLTFETLMSMVRGGVERGKHLDTLNTLQTQVVQMTNERVQLSEKVKRLQNKEKKLFEQPVQADVQLTEQQQQIVQIVQSGVTNKSEIARQVSIHRSKLYNELKALEAAGVLSENGNGLTVCAT